MNKFKHTCHAIGCKTPVPPRMLMCLRHWRKVDKSLQLDVWKHYRPGQERDKKPSVNYLASAFCAVFCVADKEGVKYEATNVIRDSVINLYGSATYEELERLIQEAKSKESMTNSKMTQEEVLLILENTFPNLY